MPKIHILSKDLQNKIAAGEVIERTASVVKELVENSLDAGAKKIIVEIEDGGKKMIKVSDDGCGMDKEDLKKSITRYATSKIKKAEDLFNLMSLGFRGEALASISAVSDCVIQTKTKEEFGGNELNCFTGEIKEIAIAEGTKVCIKNLFNKIPARLKYLKGEQAEFKHIARIMQNFALSCPSVGFKLIHNKRIIFDAPLNQTLKDRIQMLLSIDVSKNLIFISFSLTTMEINGFIGNPDFTRNSRESQYIFVNSRAVKSPLISSAVKEAYATIIPKDKYPFFILFLEITRDLVDVNVHPRKEEVKFLNSEEVYRFVKRGVERGIEGISNEKRAQYIKEQGIRYKVEGRRGGREGERISNDEFLISNEKSIPYTIQNPYFDGRQAKFKIPVLTADKQSPLREKNYRIIGQFGGCYIVIETPSGIEVFDQHAMHERVRYEQIKENLERKTPVSQKMLFPEEIKVAFDELISLGASKNILEKLGFEIEHKEENVISVKAIPSMVAEKGIGDTIKGLIDDLASLSPDKLKSIDEIKEVASLYLACRGAVMEGDSLRLEEIERLYMTWLKCPKNQTCPHGRPVRKKIEWDEIKGWFLR